MDFSRPISLLSLAAFSEITGIRAPAQIPQLSHVLIPYHEQSVFQKTFISQTTRGLRSMSNDRSLLSLPTWPLGRIPRGGPTTTVYLTDGTSIYLRGYGTSLACSVFLSESFWMRVEREAQAELT